MSVEPIELEAFRVRREVVHTRGPARQLAVVREMCRRSIEGPPEPTTEGEVEEALDRWMDPEPVSRSLVRNALWEMEKHWWDHSWEGGPRCRCAAELPGESPFAAMRAHKEDMLARMLGLTIRPEVSGA